MTAPLVVRFPAVEIPSAKLWETDERVLRLPLTQIPRTKFWETDPWTVRPALWTCPGATQPKASPPNI